MCFLPIVAAITDQPDRLLGFNSRTRFEVNKVFEIANRGRCVSGTILAGQIKIGDRLHFADLGPLIVSGVEFVDSPSITESYLALVFESAPALSELKSRLPEGAILEALD
jgi:hypothetical protein